MKKDQDVKFPSAAELFQFCRKVLDFKYGGARIIDQDVGQLLDYDPADCSHWKKGKKNVKSIHAIRKISENLGVEEAIISDLAYGTINQNEAFDEFQGYGAFELDPKVLEDARKETYRLGGSWDKALESEILSGYYRGIRKAEDISFEIHKKICFTEAPLYLQEISQGFPKIQLLSANILETTSPRIIPSKANDDMFLVQIPAGREIKPFVRFQTARVLGQYFLKDLFGTFTFTHSEGTAKLEAEIQSVLLNRFAIYLLAPANLIIQEIAKADPGRNLISQLAEIFWMSKILMNMRIRLMVMSLSDLRSEERLDGI